MKKFLNQWLPKQEILQQNRYLRWLFLNKKTACLWHINRHSVAKGVALGLFVCFLPIPGQTVLAVLLALLFCANIPVAILATWVSNPFTFIPFNFLIYHVGAWVLGVSTFFPHTFPALAWHQEGFRVWLHEMLTQFVSLGKVYAVGLLIVSAGSALLGYLFVQLGWRFAIYWRRKHKMKRIFRTQK